MSEQEMVALKVAGDLLWLTGLKPSENPLVHRLELVNAVRVWLTENEQKEGDTLILRRISLR